VLNFQFLIVCMQLKFVVKSRQTASASFYCQSIVVFGTELQGISPTTVCQSLKLLVASTCNLPDVINCQFREFVAAPLAPVDFLSPDQESGVHCLIICGVQLLTLNSLGET